jgi:hypothetical protein
MTDNYTTSPGNQSDFWFNALPVHPAVELFDIMSDEKLKVLAEDIVQTKGLRNPIIIYVGADGAEQLLDGRNRLVALERAGFKLVENGKFNYAAVPHQRVSGVDPYDLAVSLNLHRRHLDGAAKRKFAAKLLVLRPGASDRQVAGMVGISHHTVATVRNELVGRGQIAHVETRTDTKGRKQPAGKPPKPKKGPAPALEVGGPDKPDKVHGSADLVAPDERDPDCAAGEGALDQNEPKPAKPKSAPSVKDPPKQSVSEKALAEIKYGTRLYVPKMTPADRRLALEDMAAVAAMANPTLVLGVPLDLPGIEKSVPKTVSAMIAAAFNRLNATGVDDFFAHLSPDYRHDFKHISENAKAEIVKHARETTALLTHPEQHRDEIRKKMARIMSLAAKSNAKPNADVFPHALGLDAGESPPSTKH